MPITDPSDERLQALSKAAQAKKVDAPAATPAPAKVPTAAQTAIANPTVSNINAYIETLQAKLEAQNVAAGLNPDGSKKTATQTLMDTRATRDAERAALEASNPIYNKAAGAPVAPPGFRYTWIGGTTTGQYKLYSVAPAGGGGGGDGGGGGGGGGGNTDTTTTTPSTPSTSVDVLKALLKAQGFSSKIVDSSAAYLNSLLKDNLDYDNAIEVFLNTKDYTLKNGSKITSPFYTEYGYLNEGLAQPKGAAELFNAVEGYKGLQTKYGFSDKYLTADSLKGYVKNNVTVADLDERANTARLAAITADPNKTEAFIKLGFIADATGLQDFYMDSKIGKEQLESNRNTGAFVAEAIRRNSTGIATGATQLTEFKKIAAELTAKGYTEAQISTAAATGFQNIGQDLKATTALAGIYEKAGGTVETNAALQQTIQSELTQEEFMNMPSSRRKILEEQNKKAFQGTAGLTASSLTSKMV
jgi:hypothetical protein